VEDLAPKRLGDGVKLHGQAVFSQEEGFVGLGLGNLSPRILTDDPVDRFLIQAVVKVSKTAEVEG
jgi:hypothetical protein